MAINRALEPFGGVTPSEIRASLAHERAKAAAEPPATKRPKNERKAEAELFAVPTTEGTRT